MLSEAADIAIAACKLESPNVVFRKKLIGNIDDRSPAHIYS